MSQQARITVETSHPIARIRPELYSQFIEPLGKCVYEGIWVADRPEIPQENGMRSFALDALRRLGPAAVRWPGGCFADQHHWREGVGDPSQRPVRLNLWWGGLETHAFGT
ncbi:MAG: alpha-N-arabinofuranosidase, partial [Chloroflexi bacterium]|nr:alpha-N-arabinofuranosidase [Chloroflexota bacterium]